MRDRFRAIPVPRSQSAWGTAALESEFDHVEPVQRLTSLRLRGEVDLLRVGASKSGEGAQSEYEPLKRPLTPIARGRDPTFSRKRER